MPISDSDMVRRIIASFRTFAEVNGYDVDDPKSLTVNWFLAQEDLHNNWDILYPEIQEMWILFATAAIRELVTGEPTPES